MRRECRHMSRPRPPCGGPAAGSSPHRRGWRPQQRWSRPPYLHTHTSELWYWFYYQCCGAGAGLFLLKPEAVKKLRLRDVAVWLGGSVMANLRVKFKNILHKMKEKIGHLKIILRYRIFQEYFLIHIKLFLCIQSRSRPHGWSRSRVKIGPAPPSTTLPTTVSGTDIHISILVGRLSHSTVLWTTPNSLTNSTSKMLGWPRTSVSDSHTW